jgi:hypothetical protein
VVAVHTSTSWAVTILLSLAEKHSGGCYEKLYRSSIDIDFAGWSVVEAGEHNAWGIIQNHPDGLLVGHTIGEGSGG